MIGLQFEPAFMYSVQVQSTRQKELLIQTPPIPFGQD